MLVCSCVFSPFSIAITSLGEERASLGAFHTFVRLALVWFCLFPLPLGVWEGLQFVIVALPGLFSYPFSEMEYTYKQHGTKTHTLGFLTRNLYQCPQDVKEVDNINSEIR